MGRGWCGGLIGIFFCFVNMEKCKEPIRLRMRKLKSGNTSLYLDIYFEGRRSYEYLNLYLVEERSRADRERNRETLRFADAVRAKRVVEFQNGRFGFEAGYKMDTVFLEYFRMLCEQRRGNAGNWGNWDGALKHLERYVRNPGMTFREVTPEFVRGFRSYLDKVARVKDHRKNPGGEEYIDISPQAVVFMGERGARDERVFEGFGYASYYLTELRRWAVRAGVTKDVTFHTGRHTFAVIMLDLGVDIYTVQKLLGHREIRTTQIYAHMLDKKKQEAAMRIPSILPGG